MFEANRKLDDDEEGRPGFGVLVTMGKKKTAFNPSAKLDEEEDGDMGGDARFSEACEIMAKMINAGRVEPEKLGRCLRAAFEALEEKPHVEGEHTNEEET